MKNILSYILFIILFASCTQEDKTGELLKGNHELRRFKVTTEEGYKWMQVIF